MNTFEVIVKNDHEGISDRDIYDALTDCFSEAKFTVRALPQPESTERRCENCIKKKDCDGQDTDALDCPNYIANSAAEQLPQPERGQGLSKEILKRRFK